MGYVTYTFKVKRPNPGKVRRLVAFMAGPWRRGLNFCVEQAKQHRPRHAFDLHAFVSHPLRRGCGLPSQVAEACRDTAYEAYASHQSRRKNGGRGRFPHWTGVPALRLNIPRSLRLFTRGDQYWVEVSLGGPPVRLRITGKARALRKAWTGRTRVPDRDWGRPQRHRLPRRRGRSGPCGEGAGDLLGASRTTQRDAAPGPAGAGGAAARGPARHGPGHEGPGGETCPGVPSRGHHRPDPVDRPVPGALRGHGNSHGDPSESASRQSVESTTPLLAVREWAGHGALQGGSTGDAGQAPVGGVLVPRLQPVRQPPDPTFGGCLRMPALRIWAECPPEWCEEHVLARGAVHPCCGGPGGRDDRRASLRP